MDVHNYEGRPWGPLNETFWRYPLHPAGRATALGEYGGLGYPREGHEWAPELSWGYGQVSQTKGKFREALVALTDRLLPIVCEHVLAAAIYTQWSDVETEINGLLTYDRVPKLPLDVLRDVFSKPILEQFQSCRGAMVGTQSG